MPTRRDQLQAYQFMMQRVTSAIIVHETDPEQTPLRRGVGAVFAGLMIAVLVAAGFGVYGVFTGVGGTSWKADGAVVIERETGATYVYRDGALQPVLNYASARLVSGSQNPGPHRVAGEDLAGIPRRPMVGIPGAPDSLPTDRVAGAPWTMCSVLGENEAGAPTTTTTLLVGGELSGGNPLGDQGILVRDFTDGTSYLIWENHRYRITGDRPDTVIRSVFGAQATAVDAGTAWLNGLPAGQDIGPIEVSGRGSVSTVLSGHLVGDIVYYTLGQGRQYFLVRADVLVPLTEFQVRILRGQYSVEPKEIPASDANAAPSGDGQGTGEAAPPRVPPDLMTVPDEGRAALCSRTTDARSAPVISVGGDTSALAAGIQTSEETRVGTKLADLVMVPPGSVAIVRATPSEAITNGALTIVTDVGLRYPVPSAEVLTALGYSEFDAVYMPAALVQRIPEGPTLDPAAAMRVAPALP